MLLKMYIDAMKFKLSHYIMPFFCVEILFYDLMHTIPSFQYNYVTLDSDTQSPIVFVNILLTLR